MLTTLPEQSNLPMSSQGDSAMHTSKKIIFAGILLIFPSFPTSQATADPVSTLATGVAVDNTIQSIKSSAQDVIRQLEESVGISSFRARQDLAFLISELDYFSNQHRGKIFSDLNATEKRFLTDANNLVMNAGREARKTIGAAGGVAQTMESGLARLPLADKSPRVFRSSPEYLLSQGASGTVQITAQGSLLTSGKKPTVKVGGQTCAAIGATETALTFNCPAHLFKATSSIQPVSATLEMEIARPWYTALWGSLTGSKPRTKKYQLLSYVVPPTLGSFALQGVAQSEATESEQITDKVEASNEHCQGERRHGPFRFTPRAGWRIVRESIREGDEISGNRDRSLDGPLEVSESGFVYYANLQNGGSCSPSIFGLRSKDARAWITKRMHWTEVKTVTRDAPFTLPPGVLAWGRDVLLQLPPSMKQITLTVDQFNGEKKVITGDDARQSWFTVDLDPSRTVLVIRPRSLADAMSAN